MMKPDMTIMIMTMMVILIINLLTTKTSIMCINLMLYMMMMTSIMSMKIKLSPIPFITFLTMIGGLMIIFLYLAATLWMKKETLTLKTKIILLSMMVIPFYPSSMDTIPPISKKMNLFNAPHNSITIMMIILLTIMLIFTIEIHMKVNSPFRRKLKIWE